MNSSALHIFQCSKISPAIEKSLRNLPQIASALNLMLCRLIYMYIFSRRSYRPPIYLNSYISLLNNSLSKFYIFLHNKTYDSFRYRTTNCLARPYQGGILNQKKHLQRKHLSFKIIKKINKYRFYFPFDFLVIRLKSTIKEVLRVVLCIMQNDMTSLNKN